MLTHLVWPGPEGAGVEGGRLHARHQRGHIPHQVTLQSGEHRQVTLQRAVHRQCYPATSSISSRLPYYEQYIVNVTLPRAVHHQGYPTTSSASSRLPYIQMIQSREYRQS